MQLVQLYKVVFDRIYIVVRNYVWLHVFNPLYAMIPFNDLLYLVKTARTKETGLMLIT
jgi:hypothetical protein